MRAIVAIAALALFVGVAAATEQKYRRFPHECVQDTMWKEPMGHSTQEYGDDRYFTTESMQPIRITTSFLDLDVPGRFCPDVANVDTLQADSLSPPGKMLPCNSINKLTAARKSALMNKLIQPMVDYFAKTFTVTRMTTPLKIMKSFCPRSTKPATHENPGIANSDLHLYISAAPTEGNVVGWAAGCQDDQNYRPVAGHINIGPQHLDWVDAPAGQNHWMVSVMIHELFHVLGFYASFPTQAFAVHRSTPNAQVYMEKFVRGKTVKMLITPTVVAEARKYFNCPTLEGMEMDDSSPSHWERRLAPDELMNPIAEKVGLMPSRLTLAYFQDSGIYGVNWAMASEMKFGKNAGCSFISEKCTTPAGGLGKWFCDINQRKEQCFPTRVAFGTCDLGDQFADGCPLVTRISRDEYCTTPPGAYWRTSMAMSTFSPTSICIETKALRKASTSTSHLATDPSYSGVRCLQVQCLNGVPQVRVGASKWQNCPAGTEVASVDKTYFGTIICPPATDICPTAAPAPTAPPGQATLPPTGEAFELSGDITNARAKRAATPGVPYGAPTTCVPGKAGTGPAYGAGGPLQLALYTMTGNNCACAGKALGAVAGWQALSAKTCNVGDVMVGEVGLAVFSDKSTMVYSSPSKKMTVIVAMTDAIRIAVVGKTWKCVRPTSC